MDETADSDQNTITIIANGQPRTVKAGGTIADLLQELNIAPTRVVAQLNGVIVSRDKLGEAALHADDKLELVTMVGGG